MICKLNYLHDLLKSRDYYDLFWKYNSQMIHWEMEPIIIYFVNWNHRCYSEKVFKLNNLEALLRNGAYIGKWIGNLYWKLNSLDDFLQNGVYCDLFFKLNNLNTLLRNGV